MAAEPVIEPILEHVAPDLRLVPDWAPQPDPYQIAPGFGVHTTWGEVYDWVKDGIVSIVGHGKDIDLLTGADVQQIVNTAVGQAMKALSGFIDQNAAMTVQAASLLEGAIDNVYANQLHDYQDLSGQIDNAVAYQQAIVGYVVPIIEQQIKEAEARAYTYALAAQQNAQQWATQNIFAPLYAEVLKVQPAIDNGVARAEKAAHVDAVAQVAGLGAAVGTALGPIKSAVQALQTESEECTQPMCETMGPKTDLGKWLKALKLAGDIALLHELLSLDDAKLAALIRSLVAHLTGIVNTFDDLFLEGGQSIGDVLSAAIP